MANIDQGFSTDVLSLNDVNLITSGIVDPTTGAGFEAPQGSLYLRYNSGTSGAVYVKFGPNNVDWALLGSTAVDQFVKVSATDTTAEYLQSKLIAGTGISIVKSAVGNETLTLNNSVIVGDQAAIQISTTASFTMSAVFTDIIFNIVDVLNNSSVLNWTSGSSISVGQTGPYLIYYTCPNAGGGGSRLISVRVRKNGAIVIPGLSSSSTNTNNNNPDISGAGVAILTAGDILQLQVSDSKTGEVMPADVSFGVIRLTAAVGAQGPIGSGSNITVYNNGTPLAVTPFSTLNFTGTGVVTTEGTNGIANIAISGGTTILKSKSYYPNDLLEPGLFSGWAITATASLITDPSYGALDVRRFNDTTEQGIGFYVTIPATATNITLKFKGRAQVAPSVGTTRIVQCRLYFKGIPDGLTVDAWSAPFELNNFTIPDDALFHYYTQTISLTSMGLVAGGLYLIEVTRRTTGLVGGTDLTNNWLMIELAYELT